MPDSIATDNSAPPPVHSGDRRGLGLVSIISIVAAIVLLAFGYTNLVHPNIFPKRFGVVVPGQVYRSGKLTTAALTKVIRQRDINTVIDLGAWVVDTPENRRASQREQETVEALGAQRFVFGLIGDATGDPNEYTEALRLLTDPANQPVLVHCGAGTERTGFVVAIYRMHAEGLSLDEAYAEAERAGHSSTRNPHLREMLERWSGPVLDALITGERIPWDGESHNTTSPQSPDESAPTEKPDR